MSQTDAERKVLQSLAGDDVNLSPEGTASVQEKSGSYILTLPLSKIRAHGISKGDSLQRAYHAPSGCLVIPLRDDVDLFGVEDP